jgi:hypothetical protein
MPENADVAAWTSPDKFQAVWKVEEMTQLQAEAMLNALAAQFDGPTIPGPPNRQDTEFVALIQTRNS